jgi:hypothetical protein
MVFGHAEKETVHVVAPLLTADTPARICAGGCMAVTSEKHMCYNCTKTFSSLTDPSCFDRTSM